MAGKTTKNPLKDLIFNVEATEDNKLSVSETANTPIHVRVKVHNKNDPTTRNNYLLSFADSEKKVLTHSASDQTILSFKLLMQPGFDKKEVRKPRRSFINRLFPGVCSRIEGSDDESPYLPGTSTDNKVIITTDKSRVSTRKHRSKKKYKPGGCLDPPFDEDKYAYAPISQDDGKDIQNEKVMNQEDILCISTTKSTEQVSTKSSGLITYPVTKSVHDTDFIAIRKSSKTISKTKYHKRKSSLYSESAEMYFKPTKTRDIEKTEANHNSDEGNNSSERVAEKTANPSTQGKTSNNYFPNLILYKDDQQNKEKLKYEETNVILVSASIVDIKKVSSDFSSPILSSDFSSISTDDEISQGSNKSEHKTYLPVPPIDSNKKIHEKSMQQNTGQESQRQTKSALVLDNYSTDNLVQVLRESDKTETSDSYDPNDLTGNFTANRENAKHIESIIASDVKKNRENVNKIKSDIKCFAESECEDVTRSELSYETDKKLITSAITPSTINLSDKYQDSKQNIQSGVKKSDENRGHSEQGLDKNLNSGHDVNNKDAKIGLYPNYQSSESQQRMIISKSGSLASKNDVKKMVPEIGAVAAGSATRSVSVFAEILSKKTKQSHSRLSKININRSCQNYLSRKDNDNKEIGKDDGCGNKITLINSVKTNAADMSVTVEQEDLDIPSNKETEIASINLDLEQHENADTTKSNLRKGNSFEVPKKPANTMENDINSFNNNNLEIDNQFQQVILQMAKNKIKDSFSYKDLEKYQENQNSNINIESKGNLIPAQQNKTSDEIEKSTIKRFYEESIINVTEIISSTKKGAEVVSPDDRNLITQYKPESTNNAATYCESVTTMEKSNPPETLTDLPAKTIKQNISDLKKENCNLNIYSDEDQVKQETDFYDSSSYDKVLPMTKVVEGESVNFFERPVSDKTQHQSINTQNVSVKTGHKINENRKSVIKNTVSAEIIADFLAEKVESNTAQVNKESNEKDIYSGMHQGNKQLATSASRSNEQIDFSGEESIVTRQGLVLNKIQYQSHDTEKENIISKHNENEHQVPVTSLTKTSINSVEIEKIADQNFKQNVKLNKENKTMSINLDLKQVEETIVDYEYRTLEKDCFVSEKSIHSINGPVSSKLRLDDTETKTSIKIDYIKFTGESKSLVSTGQTAEHWAHQNSRNVSSLKNESLFDTVRPDFKQVTEELAKNKSYSFNYDYFKNISNDNNQDKNYASVPMRSATSSLLDITVEQIIGQINEYEKVSTSYDLNKSNAISKPLIDITKCEDFLKESSQLDMQHVKDLTLSDEQLQTAFTNSTKYDLNEFGIVDNIALNSTPIIRRNDTNKNSNFNSSENTYKEKSSTQNDDIKSITGDNEISHGFENEKNCNEYIKSVPKLNSNEKYFSEIKELDNASTLIPISVNYKELHEKRTNKIPDELQSHLERISKDELKTIHDKKLYADLTSCSLSGLNKLSNAEPENTYKKFAKEAQELPKQRKMKISDNPGRVYQVYFNPSEDMNKGEGLPVKINFVFESYKDHTVRTLNPSSLDEIFNNNIILTKKVVNDFSELIEIPITSATKLIMQLQSSTNGKSASSIIKSNKPHRNTSTNTSSEDYSLASRELNVVNQYLAVIYEKQLIPLQKTIKSLTCDLQTLTDQQELLSQKLCTDKKRHKIKSKPRICGCLQK